MDEVGQAVAISMLTQLLLGLPWMLRDPGLAVVALAVQAVIFAVFLAYFSSF